MLRLGHQVTVYFHDDKGEHHLERGILTAYSNVTPTIWLGDSKFVIRDRYMWVLDNETGVNYVFDREMGFVST